MCTRAKMKVGASDRARCENVPKYILFTKTFRAATAGRDFEYMVDEMIELELGYSTRKYCEVLKKLGRKVPVIDKRLEHILVTG